MRKPKSALFTIMAKIYSLLIFPLFLWILPVSSQEENPSNELFHNETFHLVLWPAVSGWLQEITEPENLVQRMQDAWYDGHLPTYTHMNLKVSVPGSDSLDWFTGLVRTLKPQSIEGDQVFIEREINQRERLYIPLLQRVSPNQERRLQGEILFRSPKTVWQGMLGVIHPAFNIGGDYQIQYWRKETGREPEVQTFYSSNEVLRHLLVGSIQAAASPQGALEDFLKESGRGDLAALFQRVTIPQEGALTHIYVREDVYNDLFLRTLVGETWLRDHFADELQAASPQRIIANQIQFQ